MGEIINLRQVRKARERAAAAATAEQNRAKTGTTKAEKKKKQANDALAAERLEGHRLKRSDEPDAG
jgi:hypothetical protein